VVVSVKERVGSAEPAAEVASSGTELAARHEASESPVEPAAQGLSTQESAAVQGPSAADRRAARHLLGALFIGAGLAHLLRRRLYRSLVPDWLWPVRQEIDRTTAAVEVVGGILLFVPKLYRIARWVNLLVLAPAGPAALWELRYPFSRRVLHETIWPGPHAVGPLGRAPGQAALVALLWWATERD